MTEGFYCFTCLATKMILFRKVVKSPLFMLMAAMALPGRTTYYGLVWGSLQMV